MKLKKISALLLSAATLASMPFMPVVQDIWQDTAISAEAASDSIIAYTVDNQVMYAIYQKSDKSLYAIALTAYTTIETAKIGATIRYNGKNVPVTEISNSAFASKYSLKIVDLSGAKNLKRIGQNAFSGSSVVQVAIGSNTNTLKIESGAFSYTGNLITFIVNDSSAGVTFATKTFEQSNIEKMECNGKKIRFENQAFYMSINMKHLIFGDTATDIYIGSSVFHKMGALSNVSFNNKSAKLTLGDYAFCNSGIRKVELPNTVTTIPDSCFCGCNITTLTLPESLKTIGTYAFSSATLPSTVSIGKNVTAIAETAFGNTWRVKAFEVDAQNPNYKSDNDILYSKDGKTLLNYPQAKSDVTEFATSAVTIPDCAIANNKSLKTLNIQNYTRRNTGSVTDTAYFPGLENLESLIIKSSEYSNSNAKTLISRYAQLFSGTKLGKINGTSIVTRSKNAEPKFSSKFSSEVTANFEQYSHCYFMQIYNDKMAEHILTELMPKGKTEIQKAMFLRKWIIDRADYDPDVIEYDRIKENGGTPDPKLNSMKNHVVSSVFLHKKSDGKYYTVCEGYAMCYEFLLNKAGIKAYTVGGDNTESEKSSGHAWNLIRIGGKWYHADITWDDDDYKDASLVHRFDNFLRTDAQFNSDGHKPYDYHGYSDYGISKTRTTMLANVDNSMLGDLTGDKKYTSADVDKLNTYVGKSVSNTVLGKGDMNFDGKITSADVTMLRNFVNNDWKYYATPRIYALFKAEN